MKRRNPRRKLYEGKSSSRLSQQSIKKIQEKAVYAIWYSDENGDEITSYWSSKSKAKAERKNLKDLGYNVSNVYKR